MSYPSQWDAFSAVLKRHLTFRRFGRKIKIKGTGPQAHLFDIYFCVSQLEINSIHPKFFFIFFLFWQTPSMGSRWKLRKSVFCCDFGSLWMQHVVKATHTHTDTHQVSYLWVFFCFFFSPLLQESIMTPTLKAFLITGAICSLSNLTLCKYNHFRFGVCFPGTKLIPPAPSVSAEYNCHRWSIALRHCFFFLSPPFIYLHQRNDEILIRLSPRALLVPSQAVTADAFSPS